MIGYFPTPYEDELYYSIIARYHIHVGNLSRKQTNKELFGKKVNINLELPMGLAHLVSKVSIFSKEYTKEYFINQHTVIPFVKPFKSEEWNEKIYKNDYKSLNIFLFSYSKCNVKNKKYLYYCSECLKEQLDSNGEGFWNRIHQIPGIFVCTRHKISLIEYSLKTSEMGFINYSIPTINDIREPFKKYSEELMKYLIDLAEDVEYIIRMNYDSFSEEYYMRKFIDLLGKKGFAYPIKKRREFLQKLIIKYYPTNFLELLDSFFEISDKSSWVPSLINIEESRVLHPIRHLLLMRLLSGSAKSFFENDYSFKPFGKGPWACMNPFCKNYLTENIENVVVRVNNSDRKIQGIIKCSCGFEYKINEGEKSPFDIKDFHRRVVTRGQIWEQNFNELVKQDLTLNKIAALANISRDTVIRIKNRGHLSSVQLKNKEGLMNKQKLKTEYYKEEFLKIRKENPEYSRSDLGKAYTKVYGWLLQYDKEWLMRNSPCLRSKGNREKVDYIERDKELLSKAKLIIDSWSEHERNLKRLVRKSRTGIINLLDVKASYSLFKEKYILTTKYINSNIETIEDFQHRRIRNVMDTKFKDEIVTKNMVSEAANLKNYIRLNKERGEKLLNYIEDLVALHNNKSL